ncbi:MAG TPA: pyridoxamine 5'-phosphate oxidase family protein [Sphingomicrobium sp.]|nr:pyridoxamine 5'-phosphate oxidase family protein [Sphingomicrobium sp.]
MTDRKKIEARLEEKFWEEIKESPFMMLGLRGIDGDFTRPMTAQLDGGKIYFFAARSEDLFKSLGRTGKAIATFAAKNHKLFASIHGDLVEDMDRAVIERLWNPIVASWYKDGKDDPDLVLLRFDAKSADVWEADIGSTIKAAALKMLFNKDPGKEHQDEHRAQVELT